MNVHLKPKCARKLEALAESSGRSVEDVLEEIVIKSLGDAEEGEDSSDPSVWKPHLIRFPDETKNLSVEGTHDGFSGANHDGVLYRRSI